MWAGKKGLGTVLAVGLLAASSAGVAAQDESGGTAEAVSVTGSVQPAPSCSVPDSQVDGDVEHRRNVECSPQTWTSSEPRLTARWSGAEPGHLPAGEGGVELATDAAYLRNDGGRLGLLDATSGRTSRSPVRSATFTCAGDGGYAGLSAILVTENAGGDARSSPG